MGLSKGNKDTEPSDTAYSGAFKENQTSTLSENAPTREVPASSYNEGQLKGLKDELYQAGYNQGKDIYAGIDKNSTKHRDALIASNSDGKGDNVNRSLDPSSTSSSGSSRPENSKEQQQKQLLLLLVVSVLLDTVRVLQKEQMLQLVMLTWLVKVEKPVTMTEAKMIYQKKHTKLVKPKLTPKRMLQQVMFLEPRLTKLVRIKAETDKNAIAGAVPTGEAYQAGKAKGYNEKIHLVVPFQEQRHIKPVKPKVMKIKIFLQLLFQENKHIKLVRIKLKQKGFLDIEAIR